MLELLIHGAQVVTPEEVGQLDVAVAGGRVVGLGAPGTFGEAARTVDGSGQILIPGGIDPHVHCSWYVPLPGKDPIPSGTAQQVSRAAIYGGTTTLLDFAVWERGATIAQSIEKRHKDWRGEVYTDYSYHTMLTGEVPRDVIDELPEIVSAGFPTVKIFTTDITRSRKGRMVPFGHMAAVARKLAPVNGMCVVHAEDNDLVMYAYEQYNLEGKTSWEYMPEVHSVMSEEIAVRRVLKLAEYVEGCGLYLMHLSAGPAITAIDEARARGLPVYGETLQHYACFTSDVYRRPDGALLHTYPSIKGQEDQERIWRGLAHGELNTVATDEVCTSKEVKLIGKTIDDTTGGHVGVEPRVSIMYTETVAKRGLSLNRFVDLVSSNAARIHGLFPRKGAIAVGSDADLVLLDPRVRKTLTASMLHESDYTPWEGWEVRAWPSMTILRGKIVMENGQLLGQPGDGQLVARKIPAANLSRPAV